MKRIFPSHSDNSKNLAEWQADVIEFLSGHKRYRILWWEFGPTLLNHLQRVEKGKNSNYTKNGLVLTYCAAFITASALLASTRRAAFTAAVTSSVMLLGITITVLIDYYSAHEKGSNEGVNEEYCLKLLEAQGDMPQYWWWPWSSKIKDIKLTEKQVKRATDYEYNYYSFVSRLIYSLFTNVISHQFCVARYGYLYNYQKLGGKMHNISIKQLTRDGLKNVCNKIGDSVNKIKDDISSYVSSAPSDEEIKDELEVRSRSLIRNFFHASDETSMTLSSALESFGMEWVLSHLDKSLEGAMAGIKTEEDHNKYFNEIIRKIKTLSLSYHSDKRFDQRENIDKDAAQRLINDIKEALRNIHNYVMYDTHENRLAYTLFENAPVKNMAKKGALKVENRSVYSKLNSLAYWECEILVKGRNEYLAGVRESLEVLKDLLNNEQGNPKGMIDYIKKACDENYNNYKNLYQEEWIKNLEGLSKECKSLFTISSKAKQQKLKQPFASWY